MSYHPLVSYCMHIASELSYTGDVAIAVAICYSDVAGDVAIAVAIAFCYKLAI